MFLFNLSSLEIGLLAGGGAVLLAVIVVLIFVLFKFCRPKQNRIPKSPNHRERRRMTTAHQHSTIDLPPLLIMDYIGGSRCNVMGMIDNPLKAFPCEGDNSGGGCSVGDALHKPDWRSHESLAVPRSPREFMYYMRNLEHTRESNTNCKTKEQKPKPEPEFYDVKLFSPGFAIAEASASERQQRPKRNTSGALRNPAYRELMKGNTSFHVVCTTPCSADALTDDSDSEPEISDPKARIRFTTILEAQGGSTGSAMNVVSSTSLPPTYHESKHARSEAQEQVSEQL